MNDTELKQRIKELEATLHDARQALREFLYAEGTKPALAELIERINNLVEDENHGIR